MPYFLSQVSVSRETAQAYITAPTDRTAAIAKMIEAVGGKLHHLFYALGEYDVIIISELPDNSSAAALSLAASDSGAVSDMKTTALMTTEEAVSAMQAASTVRAAYAVPGG